MPQPASSGSPRLRAIAPYFVVTDVARSAEYYRDRLGFEIGDYFGAPPCFVIVSRDGVELFLRSFSEGKPSPNRSGHREQTWDSYVSVNHLAALHQEFVSRGAKILRPPSLAEYGVLEMEVCDPDGYVLCFAEVNSREGNEVEPRVA